MIKTLTSLALLAALTVAASAQTDTNATTVTGFGKEVFNTVFGPGMTNLELAAGATRNVANDKWGEFFVLTRNIPLGGGPVAVGIGAGVDHYDHQFYSLSGQLSLKADIAPFTGLGTNSAVARFVSKQVFTPFGYMGLGAPFGGSSQSTSSPETVEATGLSYKIVNSSKFQLKLFGMYGSRQGIGDSSGAFYGGGAAGNLKFW